MKSLSVSDADWKGDWDWHWTHRQGNTHHLFMPISLHVHLFGYADELSPLLSCSLHSSVLSTSMVSPLLPTTSSPWLLVPLKVERIKERVEEKEGIPPQQQRLIYSGKQMWVWNGNEGVAILCEDEGANTGDEAGLLLFIGGLQPLAIWWSLWTPSQNNILADIK